MPRVVRWVELALWGIIGSSAVAGLAAAAVGGSLTDLGSGFGGLYGIPALLLVLVALALGVPAGIAASRSIRMKPGWLRAGLLAGVGVFVVAFGFGQIAHWIDPCVRGWWGPDSHIGSQPLCERFGSELNWHTRFHLAAHALPAIPLVALYAWTVRQNLSQDRSPI